MAPSSELSDRPYCPLTLPSPCVADIGHRRLLRTGKVERYRTKATLACDILSISALVYTEYLLSRGQILNDLKGG
jgi:hypothetical protein